MKSNNTKNRQTLDRILIGLIFISAFILSRPSSASYLALNETAEILPEGYFKLGLAPQLKMSDGTGFNMGVYVDAPLDQDLNGRVTVGAGKTDFWTSASLKWVPFPDVEKQPALGLRGAVMYARYEEDKENRDFINFQFSPIVSKLADTRYGKMIPYVGLPITLVTRSGKTEMATQFAVGAEWFSNQDMHVGAELDLNLNKAFTAASVFISFPFDQSVGYKRK